MTLSSQLEPIRARGFIRYQPSRTDKTQSRDPSRRWEQDLSIVIAGLDPAIHAENPLARSFALWLLAQSGLLNSRILSENPICSNFAHRSAGATSIFKLTRLGKLCASRAMGAATAIALTKNAAPIGNSAQRLINRPISRHLAHSEATAGSVTNYLSPA